MIYSNFNGRLGADSEIRTSKNGNQYVAMRVASNDYVNGENVTTWINVTWPGERAIKMQEYMKKGSFVSVHGTLKASLYPTKDGDKAVSVDVLADRVDFVNGGSGNTHSNDAAQETGTLKKTEPKASKTVEAALATDSQDDLPF